MTTSKISNVPRKGKFLASMADADASIATLTDEIKILGESIKDRDKMVAEVTDIHKVENWTLFAADSAAKEILAFAKNRLNKFYSPKL